MKIPKDTKIAAISGSIGTSGMTAYSVFASHNTQQQFKEHEILSELIKPITPFNKTLRDTIGWIGHYGMGIIFAYANLKYQQKRHLNPTLSRGALLGIVNGMIGITIWRIIFRLHPNPPDIHLRKYLMHLIFAHIVFGISTNLAAKK